MDPVTLLVCLLVQTLRGLSDTERLAAYDRAADLYTAQCCAAPTPPPPPSGGGGGATPAGGMSVPLRAGARQQPGTGR